jgi:hypothetical protein
VGEEAKRAFEVSHPFPTSCLPISFSYPPYVLSYVSYVLVSIATFL